MSRSSLRVPPCRFTFRADANLSAAGVPFMATSLTAELFFCKFYFHVMSLPYAFTFVNKKDDPVCRAMPESLVRGVFLRFHCQPVLGGMLLDKLLFP